MIITKLDYKLSFLIGTLIGVLLLPILFILDISFPYRVAIVFFAPFFAIPLGLLFGNFLQSYFGIGARFSKYAASGILSFAIDFATLNILSYYTGITAGLTIGWINLPGFLLALTNAYLWNKLWVFYKNDGSGIFTHLPRFLFVVFVGLIINSSIVIFMSTNIAPPHQAFTEQRWLNVAKIIASAVAVMWNFFGYKFIAFKN
ncbi:MAG: GtrA family protein [Patescibacteria group bacterium]